MIFRVRGLMLVLGLAGLTLLLAACGGDKSAATSVGLSPCNSSPTASVAPTSIPEQADLLLAAGDPDSATMLYEKVLADRSALPADKLCAARGLAAIAAKPTPKTAQQRTASGWNAAYKKELKPLQDVVVPMLVVLAVLLGLSRFATPVFVGPNSPGPASDNRRSRAALAVVYWLGVVAQTGAAVLGVLAVARGSSWTTSAKVTLTLGAGAVIAAGVGAAAWLFAFVGRRCRARAQQAGGVLGTVLLLWLVVVVMFHQLHGRPWLITYTVLAGAVGIVLVSRVRGVENRVRIAGRTATGGEDAGAGDRLRLRLQALGSRPATGLELPEQTDVTKLPDAAIGLLPEGALAKALFRVVQTFLPASPWRVSVADLGGDRLGVTIMRNGRMVSATVVHGSDLGVPAKTTVPHGLLDIGAAAFVLAELAKRYAYLNQGLSGATQWASIAAEAAASDRTLGVEDSLARALVSHAIDVDPGNAAARLAYYHRAYRRADAAEQALSLATGLNAMADHFTDLGITVKDEIVTGTANAAEGWTALQLRILYNLSVAWLNRFLLLPASDTAGRAESWKRAEAAACEVWKRLETSDDVTDLVRDLKLAVDLTLGTITAEGRAAQLSVPPHEVDTATLTGLLSIATTYDRACYRVATQNFEQALRDLGVAAADAELRSWAATDPSMTPLANNADHNREFRRIVGGPVPDRFVDLPPWKAQAAKLTKRGITSAEDLAAAPPAWLAAKLGVSTTLAMRWHELAAVALTKQDGKPLPTSVVLLLYTAGIETRVALQAGIGQPGLLAEQLATAAVTYDVDVPTADKITTWQVDQQVS